MIRKKTFKRILTVSVILAVIILLMAFSSLVSGRKAQSDFASAEEGKMDIVIKSAGELVTEKFLEIKGPEIPINDIRGNYHGSRIPAFSLKIQDLVAEGTIVKAGDYIAQLDKTEYDNYLKGEIEEIEDLRIRHEVSVMDSAVVLTNLRDEIKNQMLSVEEAELNLEESKFEPPATMRQAEKRLDRSKQYLEQRIRSYALRKRWKEREVNYHRLNLESQKNKVENLERYIAGFTIYSPVDGMVTYKKNRNGTKRTTGYILNNYDLIVAIIPDLSEMISKTYVSEIEISRVKTGQRVNISIDALQGMMIEGTVRSIALIGEDLKGSETKMFETQIAMNDFVPGLRPGMTTGNEIITRTYEGVVYLPLDCVQAGPDNIPFVYTRSRTKQYVETGDSDGKNIIISNGIEPGTKVYIIPPENVSNFKISWPVKNSDNRPVSGVVGNKTVFPGP